MAKRVRVCLLRAPGTNCDQETAFAFRQCGATVDPVHIRALWQKPQRLDRYQILAIPGGFTYGDDLGAGKVLANQMRFRLLGPLGRFVKQGKLIIGICNGFQALVKAGVLPGSSHGDGHGASMEATLTFNDSGRFEDRWIWLNPVSPSVWTRGMDRPIQLPIAHGEGKFVPRDEATRRRLWQQGQVVFQYVNARGEMAGYPVNPNGSVNAIAGICDATGQILGLMPHPERHFVPEHHPQWTRRGLGDAGDGAQIFHNGVQWAKRL